MCNVSIEVSASCSGTNFGALAVSGLGSGRAPYEDHLCGDYDGSKLVAQESARAGKTTPVSRFKQSMLVLVRHNMPLSRKITFQLDTRKLCDIAHQHLCALSEQNHKTTVEEVFEFRC